MTPPGNTLADVAAAICSVALIIGLLALPFSGHELPPELSPILGASTTWLFLRSTTAGNGKNNNGNP